MKKDREPKSNWRTIVAVLVVAAVGISVLGAGIAWARGYLTKNPHLAKVQELQQQISADIPDKQRGELFGQMRKEVEQLSPQERREAFKGGQKFFQQRIEKFFALPPAERTAALDKAIDDMGKRRKEWEQRGGSAGGPLPTGPPGPPGGPGGGNVDDKTRDQRRKAMLDNTTPEMRAQFGEFMRLMAQRRQERGLPPLPFPR